MLHWVIVVPYYFVAALAALPFLILVCRLLRAQIPINTLVGSAIGLALAGVLVPLACHWVGLAAFTGRPLLALAVLSLLFGAIDAALTPRLPLSLDKELNEL
jgi:hypothetical protein